MLGAGPSCLVPPKSQRSIALAKGPANANEPLASGAVAADEDTKKATCLS
jgi:hypothetical protein